MKKVTPNILVRRRLPTALRRSILLTFDDGPHPEITMEILNRLEHWNAKAVFFVIGNRVKEAPNILSEIVDRGHMIGNHSYSHSLGQGESLKSYWNDLKRCNEIIYDRIGLIPFLYRPPFGLVGPKALIVASLLDFQVCHWSIEGGEWGCRERESVDVIGNYLSAHLAPRDIVLLHDDSSKVPSILETVLQTGVTKGLDFSMGVTALSRKRRLSPGLF